MAKSKKKKSRRGNRCGSLIKRTPRGAYIARWVGYDGKRRERSTNTTDRVVAERILSDLVSDEALRRRGILDPIAERIVEQGKRPFIQHVEDYLLSRKRSGLASQSLREKRAKLTRLINESGITALSDLTTQAIESHLYRLRESGLSARTINSWLETISAFCNWCVKDDRLTKNPATSVTRLNQVAERRRVRRPLTNEELQRLLHVAEQYGRRLWYLCAALAGLRLGDLKSLEWRDVDLSNGTLTIRKGKSGRIDHIPIHPQLAEEFERCRGEAEPTARVFPTAVTNLTRQRDFLRAGLAREEIVRDENGQAIMEKKRSGRKAKPKKRIVTTDSAGREIDLHALRTTLGTRLAQAGVAPQIAQKIMRHSDYKTTLAHYTVLGLSDSAAALNQIPAISGTETVTSQNPAEPPPHLNLHLNTREITRIDANRCETAPYYHDESINKESPKTLGKKGFSARNEQEKGQPAIGLEPMTYGLQNRCSTN